MNGKAANLNCALENQGSDLHWQVAFSDTTDTIDPFYVQISHRRRRVAPPSSDSSAVENRFQHCFGLKDFTSQGVSGLRMLRIIGVDTVHRVCDFIERSER
jgi:hypothetical protein